MTQWIGLIPEEIVFLLAIFQLLVLSYFKSERLMKGFFIFVMLSCVVVIALLGHRLSHVAENVFTTGLVVFDGLSSLFRIYAFLLAFILVFFISTEQSLKIEKKAESVFFILTGTLGACIAGLSINFFLTVVAFQIFICSVIYLACVNRNERYAPEAVIKFFAFGVLGTFFFLCAGGILFGHTQSINYQQISTFLQTHPLNADLGLIVFLLIFFGISFFLGLFPVYFWVSDFAEGVATPAIIFGLLGIIGSVFGVWLRISSLLVRNALLVSDIYSDRVIEIASGLTMVVGALLALGQVKIRRLIAGTVLYNTGFMLLGLLVLNKVGASALLFNCFSSLFSLAGLLVSFSFLHEKIHSEKLSDWKGAVQSVLPEVMCLLIFWVAWIGFPPFSGFFGRFFLMSSLLSEGGYVLTAVMSVSLLLIFASFARVAYGLIHSSAQEHESQKVYSVLSVSQTVLVVLLMTPLVAMPVFAKTLLGFLSGAVKEILW